ncbi:MAG: hypothetical protein AAFV33_27170, partial [Chloroflexota bacterium]
MMWITALAWAYVWMAYVWLEGKMKDSRNYLAGAGARVRSHLSGLSAADNEALFLGLLMLGFAVVNNELPNGVGSGLRVVTYNTPIPAWAVYVFMYVCIWLLTAD